MTECSNTDMRDLLPDLVAARLDGAEMAVVESHVASCAQCTEEVALLRLARSVRPRAIPIDVARIVAALPAQSHAPVADAALTDAAATDRARETADAASTGGFTGGFTGPRLVRDASAPAPRPARVRSGVWRMAAAVGIAAIGGWSVLTFRDGAGERVSATPEVVAEAGPGAPGAVLPDGESLKVSLGGDVSRAADSNRAARSDRDDGGSSLGSLSDYSDEDLQHMLDRLEKWDGATSADPLPTVPIVSVNSRGTL